MKIIDNIKRVTGLKSEIKSVIKAFQDVRTPVKTKIIIVACILAYLISPIDILPEFLPLLGITDDLVMIPLILWTFLPNNVMEDARKSVEEDKKNTPKKHTLLWVGLTFLVFGLLGVGIIWYFLF